MNLNSIISLLLCLQVILWLTLLVKLKRKRATTCGFQHCGFYDNRDSGDLGLHRCHNPNDKVRQIVFHEIKGTKKSCRKSTPYRGIHPAAHAFAEDIAQTNLRVTVAVALSSFVLALLTFILRLKELSLI